MKDLAAGDRLGRKFTCAPFIPHGRGLICVLMTGHSCIIVIATISTGIRFLYFEGGLLGNYAFC